jgi:hypothetical protein
MKRCDGCGSRALRGAELRIYLYDPDRRFGDGLLGVAELCSECLRGLAPRMSVEWQEERLATQAREFVALAVNGGGGDPRGTVGEFLRPRWRWAKFWKGVGLAAVVSAWLAAFAWAWIQRWLE